MYVYVQLYAIMNPYGINRGHSLQCCLVLAYRTVSIGTHVFPSWGFHRLASSEHKASLKVSGQNPTLTTGCLEETEAVAAAVVLAEETK